MASKIPLLTVLSVAAAWLFTKRQHEASLLFFGVVFTAFWLVSFCFYTVYTVVIYPHYVSPLRTIPTVPNGHWLYGHGKLIDSEHTGIPMRRW